MLVTNTTFAVEPRPECVDVLEAVEEREHDGAVQRVWLDAVEGGVEVVGLDRDDEQRHGSVEPRGRLGVRDGRRAALDERQPSLPDRRDRALGAHAQSLGPSGE